MIRTLLLACASILLVASIVGRTSEAFQASLQGLGIWWDYIFPGLMPFLVLAELMLAYGMVDAIGALLHPLMRTLLRLPGNSGWALVQGWTTGSPSGAEAVSALVRRGQLTPPQGQRLLAVAHMPNPLFVIVVVGAGFLKQPSIGLYLLLIIWLAGLLAGFVSSRIHSTQPLPVETQAHAASHASSAGANRQGSLLAQAVAAMEEGRRRDGRTFGKALGDSVTAAVQKLLAIGGLIIFMSVILGLLKMLVPSLEGKLALTAITESHLGSYAIAIWNAPTALKAALLCTVLSWGGITSLLLAGGASVGTGMKLGSLTAAKLFHAAIAFVLGVALWRPFDWLSGATLPTTAIPSSTDINSPSIIHTLSMLFNNGTHSFWPIIPVFFALFAGMILLMAVLSSIVNTHRINNK